MEGRGDEGNGEEERGGGGEGSEREGRAVEGNRDTVLAVSHAITHSLAQYSTHNSMQKYFVGNLVTAAPPEYSSAIRL